MRGITEEALQNELLVCAGFGEAEVIINGLIKQCAELNPWIPIDDVRTSGKRYLLFNKLWDAPSTGCFDGTNWVIQPGIKPFLHQPTHYQELPDDPV